MKKRHSKGFTLAEVVGVIILVGIISGTVFLSSGALVRLGNDQATVSEGSKLEGAITVWVSLKGCIPPSVPPPTTQSDTCYDNQTPPLWPQLYNPNNGGAIRTGITNYQRNTQIVVPDVTGITTPGAIQYQRVTSAGTVTIVKEIY